MIERHAGRTIRSLAEGYPAIVITGPRQSGKTTLARALFPDHPYVSLEDPDSRLLATDDPRRFLDKHRKGAILDEVQHCPELLSYLQGVIDREPAMGRFILTGSQQLGLMSRVTQSLAGRVALVQLLPFAADEVYGGGSPSLDEALHRGLYPPVHDRNLDPTVWYAGYAQTYLERDVRQLVNIRDLNAFQGFVRLCAGRTGQLLNLSQLAVDAGITHNTARAWISILEASYIVFLLRPHHDNFAKRLVKTPKLYFFDTGLAAWLMGVQTARQLETHPLRGAIFETFVVSEMVKMRTNRALPSNLFFWRDREGHEVDVVAEVGASLVPVELKSGATLSAEAWKGLDHFARLAGNRVGPRFLVYGGSERHAVRDIQALSWTDLAALGPAIGAGLDEP
ncbi:MAG TPA: ATP-binding protein [Thermoanaerobaculaceae bacterium]|nr:ATP-binding protein [Thermoanaerobaculaceae bacterium]HPS79482.1 ATP-binding protein [Thermoanaerobaculaceae bacterium]